MADVTLERILKYALQLGLVDMLDVIAWWNQEKTDAEICGLLKERVRAAQLAAAEQARPRYYIRVESPNNALAYVLGLAWSFSKPAEAARILWENATYCEAGGRALELTVWFDRLVAEGEMEERYRDSFLATFKEPEYELGL